MLSIGQNLKCEISQDILTVKKKLGEGGQGIVYLVEGKLGLMALKWYNEICSTIEQKDSIRKLIYKGAPKGLAGKRFVWPIDIVLCDGNNKNFGYLMDLIDMSQYATLNKVWAKMKPSPGLKELCRISYELANSYGQLHLMGYCYRDLSINNFMFDYETGEVLICDNDNVGINNQSESQIWGTIDYMAPEIIMRKAKPSTKTDLHSLSVLLFQLWVWHHPFHGMMEYNLRVMDIPARRKLYGEEPIFIFDPNNNKNCLPNDHDYDTPRKLWSMCPEPLKQLFIRAFTDGVSNPDKRVTEGEWQKLFEKLGDNIVACPKDKADNFWYDGLTDIKCWYCGGSVNAPIRLSLKRPVGTYKVITLIGTRLSERHINPFIEENKKDFIIGEVVQNPKNPVVLGLKNLSRSSWIMIGDDNLEKAVPPQKSVPIFIGTRIVFGNGTEGIFEN